MRHEEKWPCTDKRYLDFLDSRDKDEIQIFFVTNYSCNFACSYCYQDQYENPVNGLTNEVTDAFFDISVKEFAGQKEIYNNLRRRTTP